MFFTNYMIIDALIIYLLIGIILSVGRWILRRVRYSVITDRYGRSLMLIVSIFIIFLWPVVIYWKYSYGLRIGAEPLPLL